MLQLPSGPCNAEVVLVVSGLIEFPMVINYNLPGRSLKVYHLPSLSRFLK